MKQNHILQFYGGDLARLIFCSAPRVPEAGPGKYDHGSLCPADLQGKIPDALTATAAKLLNASLAEDR